MFLTGKLSDRFSVAHTLSSFLVSLLLLQSPAWAEAPTHSRKAKSPRIDAFTYTISDYDGNVSSSANDTLDAAGNSDSDVSSNGAVIIIVPPPVRLPSVNFLTTNDSTPTLTGTFDASNSTELTVSVAPTVLPAPVLHYDFTDGSGTILTDKSGNNYDGSINGTATWISGAPGAVGALTFNGSNTDVTMPVAAYNDHITDAVSVAVWARHTNPGTPSSTALFSALDGTDIDTNRVMSAQTPWDDSNVYWDAGHDGGASGGAFDRINKTATEAEVTGWVHWVFSKDANTGAMATYRNGVLFQSGTNKTRTLAANLIQFTLGSLGDNYYYQGDVADFQVFDSALTPGQIATLAAARQYSLGDGHLSNSGDDWSLTIPDAEALPDGTYEVTATAITSGTIVSDVGRNELTIAPLTAPTVDPLTTVNPTPALTGTYDAVNSTALEVNIAGPSIYFDDFSRDTTGNYAAYGDTTWAIDTANQRLTTTNNAPGFYYANAGNYNRNYEVKARLQPVDNDLIGLAFGIDTGTPNSLVYACGSARQDGFASTGAGIYRYEHVTDYLRKTGGTTTELVQDNIHNYTPTDWYEVTVIVDNTARTIDCRWDNERTGVTEVYFTGIPFPAGVTEIAGSVGILNSWQATVNVDSLQVRAKELNYTLGDGHLSNNGDDWGLTIPVDDALREGVYEVTATATNAVGFRVSDASSDELVITSPTAPRITSSPVTTAEVGVAYSYDVEATDLNGDTLDYNLTVFPTGMTIVPDTGLITWVPTATGEYEVTVSVTDNITAPVTQTFTITVPNRDPVIISTPVTVASIDETYQYQVRVLELDGDILEYSLVIAPFGMTITNDTGLIEWSLPIEGQHIVEVSVDDGQFSTDTQQYTLTVIDPNINYAPEITSEPVIEGIEGILYEYQVEATDLNNDTLTYLLTTSPTGMTIDTESGLISWASPVAGTYAIEVTVEDPSTASDTQTYILTILTLPEADTMFQLIWDEMNSALVNSDVQSALGNLTLSAQEKYEPVFNNLLPNMEEIVDSYSDLERVYISPTLAQYAISREINGEGRIFFILLVNTENGWLISSM